MIFRGYGLEGLSHVWRETEFLAMTEMIVLCTITAFSIWKVLRSIICASYRLYLNKKKVIFKSISDVFANGTGKIAGVEG